MIPETGKYGIRESYGMKTEGEQKDLFLLDKKAATIVLKGGPSVLVRDASQEPGWRDFAGVARTLACVPLLGDGEILGTVTIFDKFPHKTFFPSSFTTEDLATFGKFLKYAEKAVVNAIAYERNDRLKNLDEATSLPTLKYFQERLLHEISRAKRFQRRLVLMICEVQAHVPAGSRSRAARADWVMKQVAKAIRASLREYDIVARISEVKFGMILPEAEDGKISAIPRIKKAIAAEADEIRRRARDRARRGAVRPRLVPEDGDDHEKTDLQVEHPGPGPSSAPRPRGPFPKVSPTRSCASPGAAHRRSPYSAASCFAGYPVHLVGGHRCFKLFARRYTTRDPRRRGHLVRPVVPQGASRRFRSRRGGDAPVASGGDRAAGGDPRRDPLHPPRPSPLLRRALT